jgi:prefoldin subunit 5
MDSLAEHEGIAARGQQARANLVAALRECCELAEAVESLEGAELLEVLVYLDSLRFVMAESGQLLQGVVRGFEDD